MDGIELACHIDSRDAIEVCLAGGDVRVDMTRGVVYLGRAEQELLHAWLGEALGISTSGQRGGEDLDAG